MKKVLSVILVISVLMCMLGTTAFATTTELTTVEKSLLKVQRIDADGDGSYTTSDASEYLKAAAGIIDDSDVEQYDVDSDGVISVVDAQKVLKIVSGIEPVLTQEEALALFNEKINSVKTVRPGFEKEATVVCPSIKITTMNAPIADMNVTDLEFDKYVDKIVKLMNTFPYNIALDDAMKAQLAEMKAQAKEAYQPQVTTKTVDKHSSAHFSYFPVNNLGWSSKLTMSDISLISCTVADGNIVYTVKMNTDTYIGDEYPTGTAGFSKRQALSYGKAFNIPSFDESDGSTVNKVIFKDGVIVVKEDIKTGDTVSADYSYNYVVDVTGAPQEDSDLVMKTVTTSNISENYVMNRVTVS